MNLVLYRPPIDLANLYVYHRLYTEALKEGEKFKQLTQYMDRVLEIYSEQHEDLCVERLRLKLEIRLITKGTPVTEPMTVVPETVENFERLTESQKIAFTELLKKAYRAAASLCHPDKGGDKDAFAELEEAYRHRDLIRVTAIYISLSRGRNLYWQASDDGIEWASTELNRPVVKQEMLKSTPLYEIVKNHVHSRVLRANALMREYIVSEIRTLQAELHHLRTQNGNQENSGQEIGKIEDEDFGEIQIDEGYDSAGEGPLGPCVW